MFTKFRVTKNQKKENQLYADADISSSENSIQNEVLQTQKIQNRPRDNSYRSPIIMKNNSLDLSKRNLRKIYLCFPFLFYILSFYFVPRTGIKDGKVKHILSSSPLRPSCGPSPYKSLVTRTSAPIVTLSGSRGTGLLLLFCTRNKSAHWFQALDQVLDLEVREELKDRQSQTNNSIFLFEGGNESQGTPGPAGPAWRKQETKSQNPPQLPGLKAAFSNANYSRWYFSILFIHRNVPSERSSVEKRPLHVFAHNRSFELRLKSAEENLSRAASEEEKDVKQRRWLTRRIETRQRLPGPRVSDQTKTEENISKLAHSNKIALQHSEAKPVRPSSSNAGEVSQPIPEPMVTSYLR